MSIVAILGRSGYRADNGGGHEGVLHLEDDINLKDNCSGGWVGN